MWEDGRLKQTEFRDAAANTVSPIKGFSGFQDVSASSLFDLCPRFGSQESENEDIFHPKIDYTCDGLLACNVQYTLLVRVLSDSVTYMFTIVNEI